MDKNLFCSIMALALYIGGGLATFGGVVLLLLTKGKDLWGVAEGHTLGYLLVLSGLILSISGVIIMKILRSRP
jgi:hypothetical protein